MPEVLDNRDVATHHIMPREGRTSPVAFQETEEIQRRAPSSQDVMRRQAEYGVNYDPVPLYTSLETRFLLKMLAAFREDLKRSVSAETTRFCKHRIGIIERILEKRSGQR